MRSPLATSSLVALGVLVLPAAVTAVEWTLTDYYDPQSFLTDDWTYFTDADPTNGLVTYQSQAAAVAQNLSYINDDGQYVMRVDTTEEQLAGRPSVRITSAKNFTDGVYILNATHMPSGCSVWPAWWTVTSAIDGWPAGGEIDIMENANNQYTANLGALHTENSCIVTPSDDMTGTLAYTDCSSDTGCRIEMNGTNTAATTSRYNSAGGGIYAMERSFGTTGLGIRIWYFAFDDLPSDLQDNSTSIDPESWPTPQADFPVLSCAEQFSEHSIVFTTTLCGDWAAATYNETSCAATYGACSSQVGYNGSSYEEAYWAVNSIKVFAAGGGTNAAAAAVNEGTSTSTSTDSNTTSGSDKIAALPQTLLATSALGVVAFWAMLA